MPKTSTLLNILDTQFTGHRDAEKCRDQTKEWLHQRELETSLLTDAPPVAPEHHDLEGETAAKAIAAALAKML